MIWLGGIELKSLVVVSYVTYKIVFNYEQLTALDQPMPESLSMLLKLNHQKKFVISCIYRPPSKPVAWNESFIDHIENCFEIFDDVAFLGDFNVDLKDDKLKRKV